MTQTEPVTANSADVAIFTRTLHSGAQLRNYGPHVYEYEVTVLQRPWGAVRLGMKGLEPATDGVLEQMAVHAVRAPLVVNALSDVPESVRMISRVADPGSMDDHFRGALTRVFQVAPGTVNVQWEIPFND